MTIVSNVSQKEKGAEEQARMHVAVKQRWDNYQADLKHANWKKGFGCERGDLNMVWYPTSWSTSGNVLTHLNVPSTVCVCVCVRERERDRETERQRQRQRDRHRQTDRQRQTEGGGGGWSWFVVAIKTIDAYYFRCYVLTCKCTAAGLMGRFHGQRISSTTTKRPKPAYLKTETRSRFFCQSKKWH